MNASRVLTNAASMPSSFQSAASDVGLVNGDVPVGEIEDWRREAVRKVTTFAALEPNWDGVGSQAPQRGVTQVAIEFLLTVPARNVESPRVVPVSGGGLYFEWSVGERDVEINVSPDGNIDILRVDAGVPIEEEDLDAASSFRWLISQQG